MTPTVSRQQDTDPPSLSIHMCGPDMFSEVRAAGKVQLTVIPAAGVAQTLPACCRRAASQRHAAAAVTVQHSWSGAATGRCALHVHQGAADAVEEEGDKVESAAFSVLCTQTHWMLTFHLLATHSAAAQLRLRTVNVFINTTTVTTTSTS